MDGGVQGLGAEAHIQEEASRISRQIGLHIDWIRTSDELSNVGGGQRGLYKTYCAIFAEKPYEEKFLPPEVADYFQSILRSGGLIFVARDDAGAVAAFVASRPLSDKPDIVHLVQPYLKTPLGKTSYFAEDAVVPALRRRGISAQLKKLLLLANRAMGYESMVLRTSRDSTAQRNAVEKAGGSLIEGLIQDVDSLRLDGSLHPDARVFYTFDL
ncbi:MAG: hypothetical protein JO253_00710 [Alphaproteobacteria bacterium]|nr:hypothetical protein [Alphaproteobacteria bacterium]